jgi:hypothetical protein
MFSFSTLCAGYFLKVIDSAGGFNKLCNGSGWVKFNPIDPHLCDFIIYVCSSSGQRLCPENLAVVGNKSRKIL